MSAAGRLAQWWLDHRPLGKIVDGTFVESPQRLERTARWLFGRPKPSQPPPRIITLTFVAFLTATAVMAQVLPSPAFWDYLSVLRWVLLGFMAVWTVHLAVSFVRFRRKARR